jgi:hypothetical protein
MALLHGLKHGYSTRVSPGYHTYQAWNSMRHRCNNQGNPFYQRYGGRGIKVCEEWNSFENFLADMGEKPVGLSLDRIDNDGDYCKENCRWATPKEQARNRSTAVQVTYAGKTQCISAWAEELGMSFSVLSKRLRRNIPVDIALRTSVRRKA